MSEWIELKKKFYSKKYDDFLEGILDYFSYERPKSYDVLKFPYYKILNALQKK